MDPKDEGRFRRVTQPNKKRRAHCHNYNAPGTYMITIAVEGRKPLLGELKGGEHPYVVYSELGKRIVEAEFPKMTFAFPMVEVWTHCIMPDHIHMIVKVSDNLPPKKHLGHVIGGLKGGCTRAWWSICGSTDPAGRRPLFEEGYNDGILMNEGQIEGWKTYIHDNPRRLALKRANPDLFRIWHSVNIGQWQCQMIGNIYLLNIPDIMAVVVHRADSDETFAHKFNTWMACGERGGVLVSAAIAPREKHVMREALDRGYRLILLRENGFHKYYKPGGASFDACSAGLMLQVCPWDYHTDRHVIQRTQCLELNTLALCISRGC